MVPRQIPESIKNVVQFAVRRLDPEKVVLFGSRARGDARKTSDFDIAVYLLNSSRVGPYEWAEFIENFKEEAITLFQIDWVLASDSGECTPELLGSIERDGIVLYEKSE